jgi:hypothetical protein
VVLSTSSLGSKYTVSRRPDTPTRLDRKCLEANELTGAMIRVEPTLATYMWASFRRNHEMF